MITGTSSAPVNTTRDVDEYLRPGHGREAVVLVALFAGLVGVFLLSLVLGSTWVPVRRVVRVVVQMIAGSSRERDTAAIVVETIRLPRSITALLAGAALGVAGLQMQTLFRNPLADPFALGV